MLFQLIFCTMLLYIPEIYGTFYTTANASDKFIKFKEDNNKVYNNSDEEISHYFAFVNNLNAALARNATLPDEKTIYVMNKYADLDPAEVDERYGIQLKTYDAVKEGDNQELMRSDHGVEINDNNLYNLKISDELFEKYIHDEKINFTGRDVFVHLYKFVKTLAEKNRAIYEGNDSPDLGHRADILNESNKFLY